MEDNEIKWFDSSDPFECSQPLRQSSDTSSGRNESKTSSEIEKGETKTTTTLSTNSKKSLSQEYEFTDSDDSPIKKFRPMRKILSNISNVKGERLQTIEIPSNEVKITVETLLENSDANCQNESCDKETSKTNINAASDSVSRNFALRTHRKVVYIWSEELVTKCDEVMKIPHRAELQIVSETYGPQGPSTRILMGHFPKQWVTGKFGVGIDTSLRPTETHEKISAQEDEDKYDDEALYYGLSYDCPAQFGVFEYTSLVCGATLQAAQCLKDGSCNVAINWFGGWHHGKMDSASGFCYTNDIVLGILSLKKKFSRVLYVDLDLHHGDGVEDAFCTTNKVMTVSVHKNAVGFFPGTGTVSDVGYGKGKYYSVNIPLKDGIKDQEFSALVCRVLLKVREKFDPEVVVCQCGADGLAGDPMESFNLTHRALIKCVHTLLSWKLPLLLLGGGGYNHPNTARCWTYLTSIVLGKTLNNDIPDHEYLLKYGPDYTMELTAGNMKDCNSTEYLQMVYSHILYNLNQMKT